ncbi:hypothetical protein, partial [Geomonas sp.]|uniref:hypothetical protein n=1 Tax=Geomonas sp. TaxID=2651584 RepID=UPI002B45B554
MNLYGLKRFAGLAAFVVLSGTQAWADDAPPSMGQQGDAPPEAVAACKDQREGAAVDFLTPNGDSMHGLCKRVGDG